MDLTQLEYVRGGQVDVRGGQIEFYFPLTLGHVV